MKTVDIKSNLSIVIFCLCLFSCKKATSKKVNITDYVKDSVTKIYDYSNILINRHDDKFDLKLIDRLPVKEGDTVLFNKEGGKKDKITLINKISTYEIQSTNDLNYYKTGINKFSTFRMNLKNIKVNKSFNYYTYVNHEEFKFPYDPNNMSSRVKIVKINDSLAKFDVENNNFNVYEIFFKISKNNTLDILKIFIQDHFEKKVLNYELDTLIEVNRKNKYIDLKKLQDITERKRNIKQLRR
ncbi:hypothetical protein PG911_16690 [Tenacibaculum ovolyticum]|uniref:hypothetical protein n=1 Tax=Tenacibaculum ovolyticum TaxID=104270 RepID=UPI0022F3CC6C|nr:hypothetical protein [Tenacibaculum ovolyticum]WBX76242.1 hypothetical protein PG911_16690 [Tenacibaculum ovolyticum]